MVRKNTEFYIARPKRALLSSNVASRYAFMPGLKKHFKHQNSWLSESHRERGEESVRKRLQPLDKKLYQV